MLSYDVVLRGGRVIDPESGLDAVRDVAIAGDRVAAVGTGLPPGRQEADVAGQVVTAGFVDLHSHAHDLGSARLQVADGVTTALELEAGATPVAAAYAAAAAAGRPLNYGFAASWALARMSVLAGVSGGGSVETLFATLADPRWQRAATPAEIGRVLRILESDIAAGALGIGLLLGYAPGTTPEEYVAVAALASAVGAATFTHARDLIEVTPGGPSTAPRRSSAPPARPAPGCTTAISTAPPGGTPTGYSGWSRAPRGQGRRSAPRPTPTARA